MSESGTIFDPGSVDSIHLAWGVPDASRPARPELCRADRRRLAHLDGQRSAAFLLGRKLLAEQLASLFPGQSARLEPARCPDCGRPHGPVRVSGAAAVASLAYAPGLVVAAVARSAQVSRLGVDVEDAGVDPVRAADLSRLLGVPATEAVSRWVQIEAVLKADGSGLRTDPAQVRFDSTRAWLPDDEAGYRWALSRAIPGYIVGAGWR